jgi:hypothetical protein
VKIQHILLSDMDHVLVVDGVRGKLAKFGTMAHHPVGVVAFHPRYHSTPPELKGKVFVQTAAADVEVIEDTDCAEAKAAWDQYREVADTCTAVKLARYGVAPGEVK